MRGKRGRGTDSWYPLHFAALPDAALAALADIYNECENLMVLPIQALVNFIGPIPKPAGGDRLIAPTTLIYALWTRIRQPYIREWETEMAGFWDVALRGSSALRAVLLRRAADESAAFLDLHTCAIYWDMAKFYDSLSVPKLARAALELGYPIFLLALGLQAHCSRGFWPARGTSRSQWCPRTRS